ncbi:MAG: hypothetical protein LBJ41_11110 [Treponema sp.]|nr:hypothetical protein [Treponema sp.]
MRRIILYFCTNALVGRNWRWLKRLWNIGEYLLNGTDTARVFLYQASEHGLDVGEPMFLTVILGRAGQWRVLSF